MPTNDRQNTVDSIQFNGKSENSAQRCECGFTKGHFVDLLYQMCTHIEFTRCLRAGYPRFRVRWPSGTIDRKSTRLNSSHLVISYAVFCLKKKKQHETARYAIECIAQD